MRPLGPVAANKLPTINHLLDYTHAA